MSFPALEAQILLDALAAADYSAYLVVYRPGSLPLHTVPDRATRRLLGEVAQGNPATIAGWQEILPGRSPEEETLREVRWVSNLVCCRLSHQQSFNCTPSYQNRFVLPHFFISKDGNIVPSLP